MDHTKLDHTKLDHTKLDYIRSDHTKLDHTKDVSVEPVQSTISAPSVLSKGASLSITCTAEGYRPPTMIKLSKDGQDIVVWSDPKKNCSELFFYKFQCSLEISNATCEKLLYISCIFYNR